MADVAALAIAVTFDRQIECGDGTQFGRGFVPLDSADPPDDQRMMDRAVSKPITNQVGTRQDEKQEREGWNQPVEDQPDQMTPPLLPEVARPDSARTNHPLAATPDRTGQQSGPTTAAPA